MLVAPIRGPKGMLLNMVTDAEPSQPAPTLEAPLSAEREPERARACSVVCDAAASVEA